MTGPVVLCVLDSVGPDCYVIACDVDALDGEGLVELGTKEHAKQFTDAFTALEFWKRQSTVRPLRRDGKPNRPLTALSVSPEPVTLTKMSPDPQNIDKM